MSDRKTQPPSDPSKTKKKFSFKLKKQQPDSDSDDELNIDTTSLVPPLTQSSTSSKNVLTPPVFSDVSSAPSPSPSIASSSSSKPSLKLKLSSLSDVSSAPSTLSTSANPNKLMFSDIASSSSNVSKVSIPSPLVPVTPINIKLKSSSNITPSITPVLSKQTTPSNASSVFSLSTVPDSATPSVRINDMQSSTPSSTAMSVLSEPSIKMVSKDARRETGEIGIKKSITPTLSSSSASSASSFIEPPPIPSIHLTSASSVSSTELLPPPPTESPPTSSEAPPPPPLLPSETPPPPPPLPKSVPVKKSKPDIPSEAPPISPPSPPEVVADENEAYSFLYPILEDPNFNTKIASKKEFADTQYDGTVYDSLEKIKEHANNMCRADFQLSPHQLFVRNFLSFQTPYNSLLLYHGLGTGKTCSAITICEEMRDYLSQIGMSTSQKIIIVASPNVQDNFKLQLFDRRKLKLIDGIWNIRSCTGNKYLKEINPMNMKGMDEDKVIKEVKKIIRKSYLFLGYDQFATLIEKTSNVGEDIENISERTKVVMQELKKVFGNSLIVIDEFHNIRNTDDSSNRSVATQLQKLVKFGPYLLMRLLLLSGTPMYNSYREIIWLINIMRLNDGRPPINMRDIFNDNPEDGIFIETKEGPGQITETGRENLRRFSTGYISYIRGENPYTFPYRIYPDEFAPDHTFSGKEAGEDDRKERDSADVEQAVPGEAGEMKKFNKYKLPTVQLNRKLIPQYRKLEYMQDKIYLSTLSDYQQSVYSYIIKQLNKTNSEEIRNIEKTDSIGITLLQRPLEALNIAYPADDFDPDRVDLNYEIRLLVGKYGLRRIMDYNEDLKSNFKYKDSVPEIFSPGLLGNYSSKIKSICDNIYKSEGITLIYSFYIDGGVIPMALALESMGFTRYGTKAHSLFDKPPAGTQPIDGITCRKRNEMKAEETFFPAKYIIISGDKSLSPDTVSDIKATTNEGNYDGRFVKVVIISKSGTEGLDFKNIRQTHILEPWYNINLIEQTIGRAVRNCSHKDLEFEKRNVQIFLHGSILSKTPDQEAADIYMYRLSERKARYIGEVSRVLKESAVDCLLNIDQTNFTEENFDEKLNNESVTQILSSYDPESSSNITIDYKIGDKNNSPICDYMECVFSCKPDMSRKSIGKKSDIFTDAILTMNTDKIIQRIRDIFQERYFYKRIAISDELKDISSDLISTINYNKKYPIEAIDIALTQLLEDKNEFLRDKYGRYGRLINIGSYYFFQPLELNNPIIPLRDRQKPVDFKREKIILKINKEKSKLEEIKKKHLSSMGLKKRTDDFGSQSMKESEVVPNEAEPQAEEEEEEEDVSKLLSAVRKEPTILKKSRNLFKKAIQTNIYTRGNNDWYYNCGHVLKSKLSFIPDDLLKRFIVAHILEELNLEDTLSILNHNISVNRDKIIEERAKNPIEYEFDEIMEDYYENSIIRGNKMEGIILISNNDKSTLFIKNNKNNTWEQGGTTDASYFKSDITRQNVINKDNDLGVVIGFITSMKRNDFSSRIFKTKKLEKGSIAARCDQASRAKTIENLLLILTPEKIREIMDILPEDKKNEYINYNLRNELNMIIEQEKKISESISIKKLLRILGYEYKAFVDSLAKRNTDFTLTDDKLIKLFINRIHIDNKESFSIKNNREITETELCIFQEMLLRFFNFNGEDGKRWFLTPLQVKINSI